MMINEMRMLPIMEASALSNANLLTFAFCYDIMIYETQNKVVFAFFIRK